MDSPKIKNEPFIDVAKMSFPRNDVSSLRSMLNFTITGRSFNTTPPIQNIPVRTEEGRKNHETMLKFLKDTEYIGETAMDFDPCIICSHGICEKCEIIKPVEKTPLPKKKNRYDLLKEGPKA